MDSRDLKFISEACGGTLQQGDPATSVRRVCSDSRQAQPGDLFVALRGERFDGHDFLDEVARQRVSGVMVEREPAMPLDCAVIQVDNTRSALGRLAARYRTGLNLPVVAVAGSNGKTTTKELIAAVLRQKFATLWSEASFNNDVGVPLTLLRLERAHAVAVLELGTNHPGELEPLARMTQPQFGVITNIGREHLEFFGDLEGVAREEGTLAEALPPHGKLFLNGDDEWAGKLASRTRASTVLVGFSDRTHWRAFDVQLDDSGATFWVNAPLHNYAAKHHISLIGEHQVLNALFAIALGVEFGLTTAEVQRGLAECRPSKMRMNLWSVSGVRVLDDAYNANADSMRAALRALATLPCAGRRIAVLGDMAELGATSETAHAEIGRLAAELGIGQLFAVGENAAILARSARAAGLSRVIEFPDVESACGPVRKFLKSGDLVLLKASRASRLERLGEALRAPEVKPMECCII